MRDPNRIEDVLGTIRKAWEHYPDLRFGQLVLNVASENLLWHLEEIEFLELLRDTYPRVFSGEEAE
jgi:uncharacterized protein YihD (DUF1040 family)